MANADEDEPFVTGHDVHFLARLERVGLDETERALTLYRSPRLVRAVLADRVAAAALNLDGLDGRGGRVAIAIAPGERPPYVVVERSGAFVTCLGAGMAIGGATVVPWERLRIHLERARREGETLARAEQIAVGGGSALVRLPYEAGNALTREEWSTLAAIEPLLRDEFFRSSHAQWDSIIGFGPKVARARGGGRRSDSGLRGWWNLVHSEGHLLLLSALRGSSAFALWERADVKADGTEPYTATYLRAVQTGYPPLALRALWTIARAGRFALPHVKRALGEAATLPAWMAALLGLVAIATRHRKLRAEAAAALSSVRMLDWMRDSEAARTFVGRVREWLAGAEGSQPATLLRKFGAWAREECALRDPGDALGLGALSDEQRATREQDLLVPMLCDQRLDLVDTNNVSYAVSACAVAAAAAPEDFYFPAAAVALARGYSAEAAMALAEPWAPSGPVVRAASKVGRNELCACGSGKKYKRCCGA